MRVINLTKQTVLAEDIEIADTFLKRIKGLLGRKFLPPGKGLVIRPCNSIHTFFMQFPIDVVFVDKNNRVIKTLFYLKPFRFTSIYFKAYFVIELPSGTLQATHTEILDVLAIK